MGCIYKLDFASGKSYIGLTIRPIAERIAEHRRDATTLRRKFAVHRAWAKHGEPVLTVLVEADGEELREAERAAIRRFGTFGVGGYNLSSGGESPEFSDEARQKMSSAGKGRPKSAEHRAKIGEAQVGRVFAESQIASMSQAQRARDPSTRNDLSTYWKGRKQSAEHAAKKAASHTGSKRTQEFKDLMSAIAKGRAKSKAKEF